MSGVSVALGGGGSRGLAHIGALQVLEEEGIEIRSVSGISAGAIAGALLGAYWGTDNVPDRFKKNVMGNKDDPGAKGRGETGVFGWR